MIFVEIPNNNIQERLYILDVMLSDFLGIEFEVKIKEDVFNWVIKVENDKIFEIKDDFFSKNIDDLSYINYNNLPKNVSYTQNRFIVQDNIPVVYGTDKLEIENNSVFLGLDIFASSFFMLTRWEEYVNKARDNHNRFSAKNSIALKNNFLHRPVVNEYVEMLWNILQYLGYQGKRKERTFEFITTHDVDEPLRYKNFIARVKGGISELIKKKSVKASLNVFTNYLQTLSGKAKDPYDTFDWLMDVSDKVGVKSYFFFMGKGQTKHDNRYKSNDKFIANLVKKIKKRKHFIGIHPTYNAYNNYEQFKSEKEELEKNLGVNLKYGREHFLRFEVPNTWQVWEDNNMEWDSTLSYADKEGFRCGVCYEYNVFNFLTRKKLNLKEKPLTIMEATLVNYQSQLSVDEMRNKIFNLIKTVKSYNGLFVFLWHNSSFNTDQWKDYEVLYQDTLHQVLNN